MPLTSSKNVLEEYYLTFRQKAIPQYQDFSGPYFFADRNRLRLMDSN